MATKRQGFTLIELLVVIAIIAILAAILFPVFARAKAKALETQCLSNIKQIATAVLTYCSDYDQVAPMSFMGDATSSGDFYDVWYLLRDYLKTTDILQCPVAKNEADMSAMANLSTWSTSYAVNGLQYTSTQTVDGTSRPDHAPTDGVFYYQIVSSSPWYPNGVCPITGGSTPWECQCNIEQIPNPAQWYMAWDATLVNATGLSTIEDLALHITCAACKGWNATHSNRNGGTVFLDPDFRHGGNHGRCNFAFMDGHAKSLDRSQAASAGASTWYIP